MDREEELLKRKSLATSEEYREIRKRLLDYMVEQATNTSLPHERFQWWLMMLNEVDSWVAECNSAIEKAKKKKEIS